MQALLDVYKRQVSVSGVSGSAEDSGVSDSGRISDFSSPDGESDGTTSLSDRMSGGVSAFAFEDI